VQDHAAVLDAAIVPSADDSAAMDQNRSDGDPPFAPAGLRFLDGGLHEFVHCVPLLI
jgi:hypothetical protein